jgi:phosphodiesterase/alkaline phosphatase D-like protein
LLADLRSRGGHLVAIYDDHDFIGDNRSGGDCCEALRLAARAEFVDAFAPMTTGAEVYRIHHMGDVDLVVLDERFYRTSPATSANDRNAILGGAQWTWFEAVVAGFTATYLVVASSTNLHSFADRSWEQYPAAFGRMTACLRGRVGALVISGDAHRNAVYDESGVIKIVTSAVAQRSRVFGSLRRNYGVITFDPDSAHEELRSVKVGSRFDFVIPLSRWSLP